MVLATSVYVFSLPHKSIKKFTFFKKKYKKVYFLYFTMIVDTNYLRDRMVKYGKLATLV